MEKIDLKNVMKKVAKLMALANDPSASDGEKENAINMAAKLMAKHGITEGEINRRSIYSSIGYLDYEGDVWTRIPKWLKLLYNGIYIHFGVYVIWGKDDQGDDMFHYCGDETDIEVADYVIEVLFNQIDVLGNKFEDEKKFKWGSSNHNSYMEGICIGAVGRVRELLSRVSEYRNQNNPSGAVVPVSIYEAKLKAAEEEFISLHPEMNIRSSKPRLAKGSYHAAGHRDSANLEVNPGMTAGKSQQTMLGR